MKAIMYHYVRPDTPSLRYFRHLHIDDFRRQLDYFAANSTVLSRESFLSAVEQNTALPHGCVLTFDDGFKDHYQFVLPELLARNLWGIFYVPTGMYASHGLLDVHRIHLLLGSQGGRAVARRLEQLVDDHILSDEYRWEFRRRTYRTQSNDDYTLYVKRCLNYYIDYYHRSDVLDALMRSCFGNERQLVDDFYMNENELCQMQQCGMLLGSHTVTHPVMSKLSPDEQSKEIADSFALLETVTGGLPLRTFCYPYGGFHSFTSDTEQLLEDHNCMFSFNVEARDIDAQDLSARRQALPRYDCNMFPFGQCRRRAA